MAHLGRLVRLAWGDEVDRALRPILAVGFAGAMSGSAAWSFVGIWAIDALGASGSQLGVAFLLGAIVGATSGYVGGHLSDHFGRRPLILFGWAGQSLYMLLFLAVGDSVIPGLALIACAGLLGGLGGAVSQAMVADLVPREKHEAAYASVRVAGNLGTVLGAPAGGLFLIVGGWSLLFVGVSVLAAAGFLLALRYIPRRGLYAPESAPERGSFGVIRRDRAFQLFWVSGALAFLVYVAYETVLPISLVDTHGIAPATWGFLVIINPAMVTLFQMRVTRWVAHIPPAPKLVAAMLLMGLPFLALGVTSALPVVALVILVFVVGEMLWVPTSQSVVAAIAPEDVRGAYMGAFNSTASVGFALSPFLGLQVRGELGDAAMWGFFAALSVVAAVFGAIGCRFALGRRRERLREREPAPVGL